MKKKLADIVPVESENPVAYPTTKIAVALIDPSPANKRTAIINSKEIRELAESIASQGLLQPIILRTHPIRKGRFEIVAGERRWMAFKLRKWELISAIVRKLNDQEAHSITVAENLQREDLTPVEESESIKVMLADGYNEKNIADRIGKPVSWVVRRARIADLSPKWLKAIADPKSEFSKWSAMHLELIARYDNDMQEMLYKDFDIGIIDIAMMTVKDLEKSLGGRMLKLSDAPWKPSDETLLPAAGACAACQNRTSCSPSLFEPIDDTNAVKGDRCLDQECWGKKLLAIHEINVKKAREENPGLILINKKSTGRSIMPAGNALEKQIVHDTYKYEKAKKIDKKAIPAYVVEGPGAGKIEYLKLKNSYSGHQAARPRSADGAPAPQSMKERRERLEKRRVIRFINKLMMLLRGEDMNAGAKGKPGTCRVCGCTETTPCVDTESGDSCSWVEPDLCSACAEREETAACAECKEPCNAMQNCRMKPAQKSKKEKDAPVDPRTAIAENLSNIEAFALVATFGAARQVFDGDDNCGIDDWKTYKKFTEMNGPDAQRGALYGALDRIEDKLRQQTYGSPDVKFPDKLCVALKLDRNAIWNSVLEEIPEPKNWANLKADGTPKR